MKTEINETMSCDVLVVGAGLGGICAAIQAARMGLEVIIVEKFRTLGGNSGPEVGVHPSGAHRFHPYAAETGIIEEIIEDAAAMGAKTQSFEYHYNISQLWDRILDRKLKTAGVKVLRCHYAKEPIMQNQRIIGVIVEDIATYETKKVNISVAMIDASGDGNVSAKAGAIYTKGREGKSEYGERSAPEKADSITLGSSLVGYIVKHNKKMDFSPPEGTPEYVEGYDHCNLNICGDDVSAFIYPTETGGELDTIKDDHQIYETLLGQMYSAWNHIKKTNRNMENWELVWISPRVAKRESRRFVGDYVLTQTDVESGRIFDDAIAFGGFPIDLHDPREDNPSYIKIMYHSIPPLYSIPYRCLYSKNIENLLFASRLLSVTHIAHGTTRLQRTLASCGQAAGVAAAICKKYNCTPRDVYNMHLEELQTYIMRYDGTIQAKEFNDEKDLARTAVVSASSQTMHGVTEYDELFELNRKSAIMLWDWSNKIDKILVYVKNTNKKDVTIEGKLKYYQADVKMKMQHQGEKFKYEEKDNQMEWGVDDKIEIFKEVKRVQSRVEAGFEGYIEFDLDVECVPKDIYSDEARYLFELGEAAGIYLGLSKRPYDFARRGIADGKRYKTYKDSFMFKLSPAPRYGEAENVKGGYSRRWCSNPVNKWIPDFKMPQDLTLTWDEKQEISCVCVIFDTLMRAFTQMPFDSGEKHSPIVVRDYKIEAKVGGKWEVVAKERNNYKRFKVHNFDMVKTDRIKITIERMWTDNVLPGIYQVRVYKVKFEDI